MERHLNPEQWQEAVRELEHFLVDVTPSPLLAGLEGGDHRVAAVVEVLGCMPVRGAVAAADMAAHETQAKVDPF